MQRQTLQETETQLQNGEPVSALVETPEGWPLTRVHEVRTVGPFETPDGPADTDTEVRVDGFVSWITYRPLATSQDFYPPSPPAGAAEAVSAEKIKTYYSAVEHLESFWEAVFNFIALKEAEGKQVASDLMTDCVATGAALSNLGNKGEFMPRTSGLQEKAFQSLWAFLDDPALTPEGRDVSLEAVWETAEV